MAAVDGDHAAARALGKGGGPGVAADDALDLALRHLQHMAVLSFHLHGPVNRVAPLGHGLGINARVAQFHAGHGAPAGDLGGILREAGKGVLLVDAHEEGIVGAGLAVHDAVPDTDGCHTPLRFPGEEGGTGVVGIALGADVVEALGRGEHPVAEHGAPQHDGLEQMRVFQDAFHSRTLRFKICIGAFYMRRRQM